jgi:putative transcriptional regulator
MVAMSPDEPTPDPVGRLGGQALLATPVIGDERFSQAVILIVNHDEDGALGLVLNEPGFIAVDETLPAWADRAGPPALVFMGGPVSPDRALGLARLDVETPAHSVGGAFTALPRWPDDDDTVGLVDLSTDPADLPPMVHSVRVFAGYAGWGPGQLESELSVGAWWTTSVRAADVLGDDPAGLWARVVARQPGTRALFSRFPGDPGLN